MKAAVVAIVATLSTAGAALAPALGASPAARGAAAGLAPTTPPGVTLVEVVRELNASEPKLLWVRPGDAVGRTLLVFDQDRPGRSRCLGACAREFPPLAAPAGARPSGDWTLLHRPDGSRQWAYQSHPLYTWVKERTPGEVATNVGLNETADAKLAENPQKAGSLLPPQGWRVARFTPAATLRLPDGIGVQLIDTAQVVGLVDHQGMTLYQFEGDARADGQGCTSAGCALVWQPLPAPSLARPEAPFSIVTRADGSRQWAYRGRPLYRFSGDQLPGDARGSGRDARWRVAALTRDFDPAAVSVTRLEGYGDVLTAAGRTLYGGFPFEKRWGGRNLRDNFSHSAYSKGKRLGALACTTQDCLSRWHPLPAPADARPCGFWEPILRPDGSKQWAYKGYALYTYVADKARGDHYGQATYDFHDPEGSYSSFRQALFLDEVAHAPGGAGIYWNVAHP